jgi:glycosyltransferase involved in cell wall biosynthesis
LKPALVSVVIATYRRPALLRDTVLSLRDAAVPDGVAVEVVVIDNDPDGGSGPAAAELAHQLREPFFLRYVHEPRKGLSHARNRGIEEARGDVIAFLDDDVYVSAGWLVAVLECFGRTGATAVGGRTVAHWEGQPEEAVRRSPHGTVNADLLRDQELPGRVMPGGGNAAFRRSAFADGMRFAPELGRVGNVLLSAEDSDLFQRLRAAGGSVWHCAGAVVGHRISGERLTAAYHVRQKYWFGVSYAIMDRRLHGKAYQVACAAGRAAKALLVLLPSLALAVLRRDPGRGLTAKCALAKHCGYVRATLSLGGLVAGPDGRAAGPPAPKPPAAAGMVPAAVAPPEGAR